MMWMMGYNDAGDFNGIQDPFTGRKIRPLIPRPATAVAAASPPCLARIHGTDLLALNHHLVSAAMAEHNKRELSTQQVVVSSRWNPTPEQLQTLEELYRCGTRTPSAEQIQHITAQLRRYGKIEGKNVFYWFQNHKARERQKRRRQLDEQQKPPPYYNHTVNGDKRELTGPGANRTAFEGEQTKNWASPTNSSTVNADQRGIRTQGAASASGKAGSGAAERKAADGWVQFDQDQDQDDHDTSSSEVLLQQQRRNATWQTMHLSPNNNHLIINNPSFSNSNSAPLNSSTTLGTLTLIETPSKAPQDNFIINATLFKPYNVDPQYHIDHFAHDGDGGGADEAAQTLQLFPLQSGRGCRHHRLEDEEEEEDECDGGMNGPVYHATPYQFFEFIPLKN